MVFISFDSGAMCMQKTRAKFTMMLTMLSSSDFALFACICVRGGIVFYPVSIYSLIHRSVRQQLELYLCPCAWTKDRRSPIGWRMAALAIHCYRWLEFRLIKTTSGSQSRVSFINNKITCDEHIATRSMWQTHTCTAINLSVAFTTHSHYQTCSIHYFVPCFPCMLLKITAIVPPRKSRAHASAAKFIQTATTLSTNEWGYVRRIYGFPHRCEFPFCVLTRSDSFCVGLYRCHLRQHIGIHV